MTVFIGSIGVINALKTHRWIPSVYLMQGLPFGLVCMVAPILYKTFGFNNTDIALYTSLLTLPWMVKFFLAPALEGVATKRTFTWVTQILIASFIFFLACNFFHTHWYVLSLMLFGMIAVVAAIHDTNSDGLYLECLDAKTQAHFIGVCSLFYQMGKLLSQSAFIILIGFFVTFFGKEKAWQLAFFILSAGVFLLAFYHQKKLPAAVPIIPQLNWQAICRSYKNVLQEFKQLPHFVSTLIFIFFYNLPEAQLMKIFPLFVLDKKQFGGLALSMSDAGILSSVALAGILAGMMTAGFLLARFTLKKCLIPFTLLSVLGNVTYFWISYFSVYSLTQVMLGLLIAQFCFGLGNSAYMLYLINLFSTTKKYAMSLYALGTAIMLAGMMVMGSVSGYLQSVLGYNGFFLWIIFASISVVGITINSVRKLS